MDDSHQFHLPTPKWKIFIIGAALISIALAIGLFINLSVKHKLNQDTLQQQSGYEDVTQKNEDESAVKAGKEIGGDKCSGKGPKQLSASPMKIEDFAFIIPYGLMVDGHVTPIDHQYFSPSVFNSKPDSYEVRAMADAKIVEISHRSRVVGDSSKPSNDYRFVFMHTCTFYTYYDLVTSLSTEVKAEYDKNVKHSGSFSQARMNMEVKAGQLVGRIGGQTLDFAVWDTEKPLKGFISPDLYKGERWKIYTADPLDYYSDELKKLALAKYLRTIEPASGKIDYDVDGKLVGNWFQEGSNGYEGDRQQADGRYWRSHLAFAPEHLDPSVYIASFGSFAQPGDGEQFAIVSGGSPNEIAVGSGLVKLHVSSFSYVKADGSPWDRKALTTNPKVKVSNQIEGCALVQLLENRKLKAETFPNKTCDKVAGFTPSAKIYVR